MAGVLAEGREGSPKRDVEQQEEETGVGVAQARDMALGTFARAAEMRM